MLTLPKASPFTYPYVYNAPLEPLPIEITATVETFYTYTFTPDCDVVCRYDTDATCSSNIIDTALYPIYKQTPLDHPPLANPENIGLLKDPLGYPPDGIGSMHFTWNITAKQDIV